jgi:citrate synthase
MRIGKQDAPYQSICTSDARTITVRGHDLCSEVIGTLDFTSYFWLLVTGQKPSDAQRAIMDAVLTAIAEHGLVPSVVAARMTLAAAPEAFQGAVAAGLLGCGSVVLGSAEVAGNFYSATLDVMNEDSRSPAETVRERLVDLKAKRIPVPGFGHPQHSAGDPRAHRLLMVAAEIGIAADCVELLAIIEREIPAAINRSLPLNVNGAIAAVMIDAGFPLPALKGISLLARTASLIAHLAEERERPIGFILSGKAADAISYTDRQVDE